MRPHKCMWLLAAKKLVTRPDYAVQSHMVNNLGNIACIDYASAMDAYALNSKPIPT